MKAEFIYKGFRTVNIVVYVAMSLIRMSFHALRVFECPLPTMFLWKAKSR